MVSAMAKKPSLLLTIVAALSLIGCPGAHQCPICTRHNAATHNSCHFDDNGFI